MTSQSETINLFEVKMPRGNDAGAKTIGQYLSKLLIALWDENESFSGKRPFGNSGWQYEVYDAMAKAKLLELDADGELPSSEIAIADKMIIKALKQCSINTP